MRFLTVVALSKTSNTPPPTPACLNVIPPVNSGLLIGANGGSVNSTKSEPDHFNSVSEGVVAVWLTRLETEVANPEILVLPIED